MAFGILDENSYCEFSDVSTGDWYYKYVAAAFKAGLVKGNDPGLFGSGQFITREDMAVILYRAANISGLKTANLDFVDADEISDYAVEAVSSLTAKGVINGFTDGSFGATENATRAIESKNFFII